jgi:hypothetical protein
VIPADWTSAAVVAAVLVWIGIVWAQGAQKFQDHSAQLYNDFKDSGEIDAALARIDSQFVSPALVALIQIVGELHGQAIARTGTEPDISELLDSDKIAPARRRLARSMRLHEAVTKRYEELKHTARRARESALLHIPFVILATACYFFLDPPWRIVTVTLFVFLALLTCVVHFIYWFMFGRQRDDFEKCLSPHENAEPEA